jgi:hypothetical protein
MARVLAAMLHGIYLSKNWEKRDVQVGQPIDFPCPPLWLENLSTTTEDTTFLVDLQLTNFVTWSEPLALWNLLDPIVRQRVPPFISLSRSPQSVGVYFGIAPCWSDVVLAFVPAAGGEVRVLHSTFLYPNKGFWLSGPPGMVYLVARGQTTPCFVTEAQPGNVIPLIVE